MKIGIDLQCLQIEGSRNRGIGRYVRAALGQLLRLPSEVQYRLYADNALPAPELDGAGSRVIGVDLPDAEPSARNDLFMKAFYLCQDIDTLLLPSPMAGMDEATVPSLGHTAKRLCTICYDLIPLIFRERYLQAAWMQRAYMRLLENIRRSDLVFAISEATRQDTIRYLGVPARRVVNVSAGVSEFFHPIAAAEQGRWRQLFGEKLGLTRPFVLYTGGEDWRKNLEGLVRAFALLPPRLRDQYQLVIACRMSESGAKMLADAATNLGVRQALVLTNYVTDEEMRALYSLCDLFVFPSLYEGFGLPLVEAMACGAPAIAAGNSSLVEIVAATELLFDAAAPEEMAHQMGRVLGDEDLRRQLSAEGLHRATVFTWDAVAARMRDALDTLPQAPRESVTFHRVPKGASKKAIAFFSPFTPVKSGISDYSEELLPALCRHFEVDGYHDPGYTPRLASAYHMAPDTLFARRAETRGYEAIVYQMGNSTYHSRIYAHLLRYSGITVLHDYFLAGMLGATQALSSHLNVSLGRELAHSYGPGEGGALLDKLLQGHLSHHQFPELGLAVNRRIFSRSLGVALHSRWAYDLAVAQFQGETEFITHIPLVIPPPVPGDALAADELRRLLAVPRNAFVVSCFGLVGKSKRFEPVLQAFAHYRTTHPEAILLFVGHAETEVYSDITRHIRALGLAECVRITGHVSLDEFYHFMHLSDLCLNLRFPFQGETSSALLRILSVGKPTVVTDIGSFADLPDEVVHKIPPPDRCDEVGEIVKALLCLTDHAEYRRQLGERAAAFVARENSPAQCARLYAEFIDAVYRSPLTRRKLLADHLAREAADPAGNPIETLTPVARLLAEC